VHSTAGCAKAAPALLQHSPRQLPQRAAATTTRAAASGAAASTSLGTRIKHCYAAPADGVGVALHTVLGLYEADHMPPSIIAVDSAANVSANNCFGQRTQPACVSRARTLVGGDMPRPCITTG
jgi:hypothetical protein